MKNFSMNELARRQKPGRKIDRALAAGQRMG